MSRWRRPRRLRVRKRVMEIVCACGRRFLSSRPRMKPQTRRFDGHSGTSAATSTIV